MADNSIARVNYYDRQFLQTQDFSDEQAYHLAMHRRHNIGGHIWGILFGLEVILDKAGNLNILPGVAIDGYGRELTLPYPRGINSKAFDEQGSERLEVWLAYARQDSAEGQDNWLKCNGQAQGQLTRSEEFSQVLLLPPDPNLVFDTNVDLPPRRQPLQVPTGDVRFDPTRIPPDDPARSWRVYLGMIQRQKGKDPLYVVSPDGRPYGGLVGEWIRSPSGRAFVQVGAEKKDDPYRFAVYLPETADPAQILDTTTDLFPTLQQPRLAVTTKGEIQLHGNTTIEGDLTMDGGGVEFGVGLAFSQGRPWNIYNVTALEDPTDETSLVLNQLRIEMGSIQPGSQNQVVIGAWSAKENGFKPCLTIADDCSVRVHGNLNVEGIVRENVVSMSRSKQTLSAEARANKTGLLMAGLANRLTELNQQGGLNLGTPVGGGPQVEFVQSRERAQTVAGRETAATLDQIKTLAQALKDSPGALADLLDQLVADETMRRAVSQHLEQAAAAGAPGLPDHEAPAVEVPVPARPIAAPPPPIATPETPQPSAPESAPAVTPHEAAEAPAAETSTAAPETPETPPAGEEAPGSEKPPAQERKPRRKGGGAGRNRGEPPISGE
jgi:hypothetical protein